MKKLALLFCILISHISCIVAQTQVTAVTQYNECLDLKAVVTLFSNSSSVEDFEKSLNNSNLHISNLDLNNDGYADYLRCVEVADGLDRYIIIQAIIDSNLYQDVATIFVTKDTYNEITVQIIGDSYLYGNNYIIQPTFIYYPRIYSWLWCSHWRCGRGGTRRLPLPSTEAGWPPPEQPAPLPVPVRWWPGAGPCPWPFRGRTTKSVPESHIRHRPDGPGPRRRTRCRRFPDNRWQSGASADYAG